MMLDYLSMRLCIYFVEILSSEHRFSSRIHTQYVHTKTKAKEMKKQNIHHAHAHINRLVKGKTYMDSHQLISVCE